MSAAGLDTLASGRFAEVSAALLLGGASQRMGRDKAQLALGGVAAALRLARLLDGLFEELLLVGGKPPEGAPGRAVADPPGPRCALRGLVGALEAARGPRVLVVATDLVALTPDLVLGLLAWPQAAAVVPMPGPAGPQPLCAIYAREAVLPLARRRLAEGRLALRGLLEELEVAELAGADLAGVDPEGLALANVNTPAELAELEARLAGRAGA